MRAKSMMQTHSTLTRRQFLRATGATVGALTVVPRHVVAASGKIPPGEKLNLSAIGIAGMGAGDLDAVAPGNNLIALCDVDWAHAANTFKKERSLAAHR